MFFGMSSGIIGDVIRKFLCFILVSVFVLVTPALLLFYGIAASFLNRETLTQKIIPDSYSPVTGIFADQFAQNPADAELFAGRIRTAIPKENYADLLQTVVTPFFDQLEKWRSKGITLPAEVDLNPLTTKIKETFPRLAKNFPKCEPNENAKDTFRFCKPPNFPSDKQFELIAADVVEKQIPPQLKINAPDGNPGVINVLSKASLVLKLFNYIVFGLPLLIIIMVGLIVFSPLHKVASRISLMLIEVSSLLILLMVILHNLPSIGQISTMLTPAQISLMSFTIDQPVLALRPIAIVMAVLGIALFVLSIFFKKKKI